MAMKNKTSSCIYLIIIVLVLLISDVHCRALKSSGCDGEEGAENSINGIASFLVSSNNSTTTTTHNKTEEEDTRSRDSTRIRSLTFKLASGPSKKGPGH
ncbi:hypothetical protein ACHQM5_025210 [Ranunculus cassubicifolius]